MNIMQILDTFQEAIMYNLLKQPQPQALVRPIRYQDHHLLLELMDQVDQLQLQQQQLQLMEMEMIQCQVGKEMCFYVSA